MTGPNVSVPLGKNKLVQTNNSQTAAASDGSWLEQCPAMKIQSNQSSEFDCLMYKI